MLATAEMNTLPMRRSHPVPVYSAPEGEKRNAGKSAPHPPHLLSREAAEAVAAAENAAAATAAAATFLVRYFVIFAATAAVCLAASKSCYNAYG